MIYEQRTLGAERVDTVRITLDTPPELIEQYAQDGYTEVMEHYLVLYKPPEKIVLKEKLGSIAAALPDDLAIQHPEIYPQLVGDGKAVEAGQRRLFRGVLVKANVTVWDRPDQWPDADPKIASVLWTPITGTPGPDGEVIEDWVQPAGAHDAYKIGDVRAHNGKTWRSTAPNNTWVPGAYGWEEVA